MSEYDIPSVIVVTAESWAMIVEEIENPSEPTPELRAMMNSECESRVIFEYDEWEHPRP